jgi:hypothetical protein
LRRAIDRGELSSDTDIDLAIDLITSPPLIYGVYLGRPLPPGYPERLTAAVLRALDY